MKLKGLVPNLTFPQHLKQLITIPSVVALENRKYPYQPITFKGTRIYLRDDLFKLTYHNIEQLKKGKAPMGKDGKPVTLHHLTQTNKGSLCMMSDTEHHQKYDRLLHSIYPLNISDETKNWLSSLGKKRLVPIAKPVNRRAFETNVKEPFWQFLYEQITDEIIVKPKKVIKPKLVDRSKHPINKNKLLIPQTLGVRGNAQTLALEKLREALQALRSQLSQHNLKPQEITALRNTEALLEEALADIKLAITRAKNKRQTKTRQQGRGSR